MTRLSARRYWCSIEKNAPGISGTTFKKIRLTGRERGTSLRAASHHPGT
jgi:hypothetical protein